MFNPKWNRPKQNILPIRALFFSLSLCLTYACESPSNRQNVVFTPQTTITVPAAAPTALPVTQPVSQPVPQAPAVPLPVTQPVNPAPVAQPVQAPPAAPTAMPIASPIAQPTALPLSPTPVPISTPVIAPTPIPVATPTPQPTATPTPQPVQNFPQQVSNSLGMNFVYIAPGTFLMGSPSSEPDRSNDETQHSVTLTRGYYLQTTEVTQAQWQTVMGNNPSNFKENQNLPVENVSWEQVQNFITALNQRGEGSYRLPTEAEWEYAARSGSSTRYSLGDSETSLGAVGWYSGNSGSKSHPVGQKQPNAWGLYDMHGNVWEWVQDWYGAYPSSAVTDPQGPGSGSGRVIRGGGWNDASMLVRSAIRYGLATSYLNINLGLRLVRVPG